MLRKKIEKSSSKSQSQNQLQKKPEKGLSKSQSQNQKSEYAGKRTLNRERREEACDALNAQYVEILRKFPNQINKIESLSKEITHSLGELDLREVDEKKESLVDNTIATLTGGIETLQNFQNSLKDLGIKLERHNEKIKLELQKEARFIELEKEMEQIKKSRLKQKTSSYQVFNEKLNEQSRESGKQADQKANAEALRNTLERNIRASVPQDLRGDFDHLLELWKQRSNSSKSQNNEEKILREDSEKNNLAL